MYFALYFEFSFIDTCFVSCVYSNFFALSIKILIVILIYKIYRYQANDKNFTSSRAILSSYYNTIIKYLCN